MRWAWLALVLLAGCARSNAGQLAELERRAVLAPDPEADRLIGRKRHVVPAVGRRRSLTLEMLDDLMPTVMGEVNGVELPLIVDSGASLCSLSGPAARAVELYVPPGPESRAISPGFDAVYRSGVFRSLRLGEQRFGRGVAVVPLRDHIGGRYGIVGCSVLSQYRATFDFVRREIRLEPAASERSDPFFVTVRVNGRPLKMLMDTGATKVFLEPRVAIALGLIGPRDAAAHREKSGTFRAGRVTRVRLETVEIAGKTFTDVSAGVVLTFGDEVEADGLLGPVGLGKHSWTLDFSARTVRIND